MTVAAFAAAATSAGQQALFSHVEVLDDRSLLTFDADIADRGADPETESFTRLVALPPGATQAEAVLVSGPEGARAQVLGTVGQLRGVPVALLSVERPEPGGLTVELRHDGRWSAERTGGPALTRDFAAVLQNSLPEGVRNRAEGVSGTYLILTTSAYEAAVAPLVDWKRRKGHEVRVVTTAETGNTNTGILAWLRNAYATWELPPEYLLIVGDVADIPTWNFSGNPTDHPYTLMDANDWLPDLFLGRMPASSAYQVSTIVAKTIAYERAPATDNPDWTRRYLMVAGNYGSETPVTTVQFCGEQLTHLGFENAFTAMPGFDGVYFPPIFNEAQAVPLITNTVDSGVGIVTYRGWAYGTSGWEPPHFTTANIPGLANGGMTPVVMSFVCLNGNFADAQPCFGEAWLQAGAPDAPKGAVAFIGNGEHWSHTRYNDAMAIAFYERIVDPALGTLGGLAVAGKLRFMDYFPHQLEETGNEESVEFYVHIYNLLGDPELNIWRNAPAPLTASHPAALPAGANQFDVTVTDGGGPVAGARVGVVQGETLLGCAFSGADGVAHVTVSPLADGTEVAVTVTAQDHHPYEGSIAPDASSAFLSLDATSLDDGAGNGDGVASPGETVDLTATLRNAGGLDASAVSATLAATAGATVDQANAGFADIGAGQTAVAGAAFTVTLANQLEDGQHLRFTLSATHDGGSVDVSDLMLPVVAPALVVSSSSFGDPGYAPPGGSATLTVTLANRGHLPTGALSGTLELQDPTLGTVDDAAGSWAALALGGSGDNAADPFTLSLAGDVPHGKSLPLMLHLADDAGFAVDIPLALTAGLDNPAAPVGPDAYGYYAYDSADLLYANRPTYAWRELSPQFGGGGTELVFNYDNEVKPLIALPFDFVYYGQTVTQLRISDNGWISFDPEPFDDFYNWGLPNQHGNASLIAPFYDNLTTVTADSLSGSEYIDGVYHDYDAADGTFTVEWSRVRHYRPEITDLQTFEVVLYDPAVHPTTSGDGEIGFFYRQVNNADYARGYATVGMEDDTETIGLQLSYSGEQAPGMLSIGPGLAVKLSTEPPVYEEFLLDGFSAVPAASGLALSWSTSDPRPVLGWRVERLEAEGAVLVAELPVGRTHCEDAGADAGRDQVYRLTALHPYDLESALGPFHSLLEDGGDSALRFSLGQSLPNPMRESARIDYVLPAPGTVNLRVFDAQGRLLRTLVEGEQPAGQASRLWDGRDAQGRRVPTGVYFYRLEAGGEVLTRKLMVIR